MASRLPTGLITVTKNPSSSLIFFQAKDVLSSIEKKWSGPEVRGLQGPYRAFGDQVGAMAPVTSHLGTTLLTRVGLCIILPLSCATRYRSMDHSCSGSLSISGALLCRWLRGYLPRPQKKQLDLEGGIGFDSSGGPCKVRSPALATHHLVFGQ